MNKGHRSKNYRGRLVEKPLNWKEGDRSNKWKRIVEETLEQLGNTSQGDISLLYHFVDERGTEKNGKTPTYLKRLSNIFTLK